jgi:hypothetical protein
LRRRRNMPSSWRTSRHRRRSERVGCGCGDVPEASQGGRFCPRKVGEPARCSQLADQHNEGFGAGAPLAHKRRSAPYARHATTPLTHTNCTTWGPLHPDHSSAWNPTGWQQLCPRPHHCFPIQQHLQLHDPLYQTTPLLGARKTGRLWSRPHHCLGQARELVVPTDDHLVQLRLRELSQPIKVISAPYVQEDSLSDVSYSFVVIWREQGCPS